MQPMGFATRTQVLILDEPTNYLDREGLGALILAIKDYKGGVLIISHNKARGFSGSLDGGI